MAIGLSGKFVESARASPEEARYGQRVVLPKANLSTLPGRFHPAPM
jgi:hypothetical protein